MMFDIPCEKDPYELETIKNVIDATHLKLILQIEPKKPLMYKNRRGV